MDTRTWKILLVDDDEDDYFLTRHMLTEAKHGKYILEWASTYDDGWSKIQAGGYDAVLMDYDLGPGNGLDLIRSAVANGYPFPIILYTGRGSYEVDLQAMHAGAALYLTKNEVNPLLLERSIRYAIERKQYERALEISQQEQARLASFPELNPNPILEIDLSGNLQYINPHAQKLFPDLKKKGIAHPYLAAWEEIRAHVRKEPEVNLVREVQVGDHYYQQSIFFYQQKQVVRIYGMDISVRKQAELALEAARAAADDEKNRLEAIMRVLPVGVAITDAQGGSIEANPAYEKVWGGKPRPAQSVADYVAYRAWWADTGKPVSPEEWASAQAVMRAEAVLGQVLEIQRFDGKRGFVLNSASPVKDSSGRVVGSAVAIQDITPLKQSELLNQALNEIQQALHSIRDFDAVMQQTVSVACKALGSETAAISLVKDHRWQVRYVYGFPPGVIGAEMNDDEERHAVLAIQTQKPVAVNDACNDERVNQEHMRKGGVRSALVVPVLLREEAVGVLFFNYMSTNIEFQEYHIQFGVNLAASISMALENDRLIGRLMEEIEEHKRMEKALQAEEAALLGILNATKESIWMFDSEGIIQMANTTALSRFNKTAEEVVGKHFKQILPVELAQSRQARFNETIETMQPVEFEDQRAGILFHHSFYPVTDASGLVTGVVSFSRDITQRKQAEAELERYAHRLEQSNQDLQDYAFIASHDMQEPLRKLQSFAGILQEKVSSKLDAEENDYLERICNTAERMANMLRVLLDYSSLNTTAEPYRSVDLAEVIADVLQALEYQIDRSGGQVEVGEMPVVEAEPTQMHQLLQNLIGNALKFSRPGIPPYVRVFSQLLDNPSPFQSQIAEIRVEDNGIGFDPQLTGKLFLPFHRSVGRSEYEGSGMGLAICRKIVERHGGTIDAEAQPGQGATFILRLPVRQSGR